MAHDRRTYGQGAACRHLRPETVQIHSARNPGVDRPRAERVRTELATSVFGIGCSIAFYPPNSKARVSGMSRWLTFNSPLIQLSLYGKTNDRLWFNLIHEATHILLHSDGIRGKRHVFMDDFSANDEDLESAEIEANRFAADTLIPPHHANRLSSMRSEHDVIRFATEIGIHPGIVVAGFSTRRSFQRPT